MRARPLRPQVRDDEPLVQSTRLAAYEEALLQIAEAGQVYPCGCSRREVEQVLITLGFLQERDDERVYPGTCRAGLGGKPARALRVLTVLGSEDVTIRWTDRRLGRQRQNLTREVGDFIVKRADGVGIETVQLGDQCLAVRREVGLGQHEPVGHRDLLDALRAPEAVHGIDGGDDIAEMEVMAQDGIGLHRRQDRKRISQP